MNSSTLPLIIYFFIITFILPPSCLAVDNRALGKPYTLSVQPSYPLSAPSTDRTSLTDGKYTIGHFWTQKTTVGWRSAKAVEILIDLEQDSDIGIITFNTARGREAGVYYPAHVAAFVGPDREHLLYVGDLADDPENQPGSYRVKKFILNNVDIRGRYVLLEAIPKGAYLFCDEIEVAEGVSGKEGAGNLSIEQARERTEQIRRVGIDKGILAGLADDLRKMTVSPGLDSQVHGLKRQIASMKSVQESAIVETEMLALRRSLLASKFPGVRLLVRTVNQWAPFNPVSPPVGSASSLSFVLPQGGYDAGAVAITNLSTEPREIVLSLNSASAGVSISLYNVPFVKSAAMEYVADPLVPVAAPIVLRPGESRMVFVTAFGKEPGSWNTALQIKSDGSATTVPISIKTSTMLLPENLSLNAVSWGYLDFKLVRDRQKAAVADLLAHHTNVVVVPPEYLPLSSQDKMVDFSRLESYLRLHRGAEKVMLFMNLQPEQRLKLGGGYPFLGDQWKAAFKLWYEGALHAAVRAGFRPDRVYLYPFDEMDDEGTRRFIDVAVWARKEIPGVRFYATLNNKTALKVLPYLDVAQVANAEELLGSLGKTGSEIWIYNGTGLAKSLSPYSYYRLKAWKAFQRGYTGIGFWAYADAGWGDNAGTAWDDFDGDYPDHAVVYEGDNGNIISSRRWEAWRMGIEDYELLTMYAKAKGDAAAKALANDVLDHPEDTTKADSARRKILMQL